MKYSVDVVRIRENAIQLNGWAIGKTPESKITYEVEDGDHRPLDFKYVSTRRDDVSQIYFKKTVDQDLGFDIQFPYERGRDYYLVISGDGRKVRVRYNEELIAKRSSAAHKRRQKILDLMNMETVHVAWDFFKENGLKALIVKSKHKLQGIDSDYDYSEWQELTKPSAEELEAQLTELRRETDTIQATVDGIEAEEKTARADLISAQTRVDRLAAQVEEAARLNELALREYDDLTARMEQLRQQKISGGELVKKLTEEVERLTRLSAEGMAAHEMLTAAITEAAEKVTALQMEDIARQKDCEAVQMAIEQMEGQQSGSEAALAALRERQEQLKKDNEVIREEIEQITAGAQSGSSEIEELRRDIKDADAQRDQLEMRRNILSKENSDVISRREAAASELLRLQEKSEGMQEQQNSISAKMWEEYELTRSEAAEQAIPLEDVGAAQKRLSELRGKIRALGAVNVAAIEEYEEVSGRYRFMKEQIDDAENAKKELTRLITELSAQMSAIFTERFAGINRYFGEIFRELFGGGHAELRLTDATDPLETGIEIIVQPPGKIIKNLSALSGGEQAFVAICIYFAILRVNPAPFVLIDEIEAALDDVNVGKFAAYLHRMTDHTQFISITHRRGTMEQGDVLYGVTMEEEGISKLLRLDVAEMEKKFGKSLN